ncbi:hypothetical protein M569_11006, partial [Genlisea aurea]
YNRLIRGGSSADAISWYSRMLLDGVAPDRYTFPYLLSACSKTSNPIDGAQLHASAVKLGFRRDVFVANSFVFYYGDLGDLERARKVFDEMPEKNVVSWTSLISSYTKSDRHREAVSAFVEMTEGNDAGIEPNEITTATVISACAKLRDLDSGERVLNSVAGGIPDSPAVANAVANMYMRCGAAEKARKLFDETPERDAILYNTMISNYVKLGEADEALEILRGMIRSGRPRPDRVTLLAAIAAAPEARIGMEFHGYASRNGLLPHPGISNALVDMYGRLNRPDLAHKVFDQMPIRTRVSWNSLLSCHARNGDFASATEVFSQMPQRNIVSWNTMISSLVQHGFFPEAIGMFRKVQREGTITPDETTMVSVASACGHMGALGSAKWVYRYVEKNGIIRRNVRLETALVDMFARCGETQLALEVFRRMPERDVSAWTAAIGAMAKEGNGEAAVAIFREMIEQKFPPDAVVFSALLTACSHSGLVKQGMNAFRDMKKIYGLTPKIIHYGCVVDLLGRAGLLSEALDFISDMPMEPNAAIWRAFLAACRIHKNEEMATTAAERMAKSDSEEVEVQILLSNIYASVGKWDDVAKVRKHMKRNCTKKTIPGSSSIEVNGAVHEFTTDDDSHQENELLNSMLREMYSRVSDAGYFPDLNSVLHDVDEDEKQCLLSKHSEKVAIAFGLLCSCKGVAIRVVKNLRICSDCHSFAKTVSKVYRREIVIRDNNRFHFFRQGSCSCNDYW